MTDCKILLSTRGMETLVFGFADNRPVYLARALEKTGGDIFLGRVENYLQNLKAAFVRFDDHEIGYLSLSEVPKGALLNRSYEKDDPLKAGDLLCVQMLHAAHGTKQAKLSAFLSLHGEYAVLGLEKTGVGCAKSLSSETRSAITGAFRALLKEETAKEDAGLPADFAEHFGVILRTESGALYERLLAEGNPPEEAATKTAESAMQDVCVLFSKMTSLVRTGATREPGSALYRPDAASKTEERLLQVFHFLERAYPGEPVEIVCASEALYDLAKGSECLSRDGVSVRVNADADTVYGINGILEKLTHRVVWLPCGAYLVIEDTEAMTVVDVNSGKYTANKDDDFLKVNLEAAEGVMREMRLRGLSGIIVVDFINMREGTSVSTLKETLSTLASFDPVHTTFHDLTLLGLAEITRSAS